MKHLEVSKEANKPTKKKKKDIVSTPSGKSVRLEVKGANKKH